MAVVAVTFDGTRLSTADTDASGGTWDKYASGQPPSLEEDIILQGPTEMSNKVSNTDGGVQFAPTSLVDMETTPKTVIAKIQITTLKALDLSLVVAASYELGVDDANYYQYIFAGLDVGVLYPVNAGWWAVVIDPNIVAYRDDTIGTVDLTTFQWIGLYTQMAVTVKAENVIHSALDYVDNGTGLTLLGGTSTDPDGTFLDFVLEDEDVNATPGEFDNRWRLASRAGGSNNVFDAIAVWTIGSSGSAAVFTDSNKILKWADGWYGAGFAGLDLNLENAGTVITIDACTFVGDGRAAIVQEFHTNDDVDGTNEELDIIGHGYKTGDYVDYSKLGGTDTMGLTDGADYWIEAVTLDSISLHTTRQNAFSGTTPVDLTASAGTETHRLTKLTDTRPDAEMIGTSGSATVDGCSFLNHNEVTFTSAGSMDGGRIEAKLLVQNSADISNVTIVTSSIPQVATLQDPVFGTTTDLHDVQFIQAANGHALELDTATSYDLTNIIFTGYGANDSNSAAIFVSATSGTVTINVLGGSSPTYRTAGATVVIVLNPVALIITALDITPPNDPIQGAAVTIWAADGTGDLPYNDTVTIAQSAGVATVTHSTAHNLSTGNKVEIKGANENNYNRIKTITVTGTLTYTYLIDSGTSSPATGSITATGVIIDALTNASGIVSDTRSYGADQPWTGKAQKGTSDPVYVDSPLQGDLDKDIGQSVTALMIPD